FIDLVAVVEIDGTPGVAFEAGVEEARRVLQRSALGEGHLHDILVRLAGADHSGVRPHRNPSPLPLLDHIGNGLLNENSDPSVRLALYSRIYQLRGRVSSFSFLRAARPLHGCCRFLHGLLSLARYLSIPGRLHSIRPKTCSRFAKNFCHPYLAPW